MSVYIQVADKDGNHIAKECSESLSGYTDLVTALSILLRSTETPWEKWQSGWKISRIEDDPAGYLPWFLCLNDKDGIPFGQHEAEVVLEHIKKIGFEDMDDAHLTAALDRNLGSGQPFDGAACLRWFRMYRDAIIARLRMIVVTDGSHLITY